MPEASRRTIQFSPDADTLPEGLLLPPGEGGEVVVFLVSSEVRGWAGPSLLRLARGWAERGRRPLLVEGDFPDPLLPPLLGTPPGEGIADALLYGASIERIETPAEDGPVGFISPGTVVPDPVLAWQHPGWPHLLGTLRAGGRVVLLVLPADREATRDLVALADRVFQMRGDIPDGSVAWPVIHPPEATRGTEPPAPGVHGASAHPGGGVSPAGPVPDGAAAPSLDPPTPAASPATVRAGSNSRGRGRALLLLLVVVFLALILLGAAWFGFIEIPGLALPGA